METIEARIFKAHTETPVTAPEGHDPQKYLHIAGAVPDDAVIDAGGLRLKFSGRIGDRVCIKNAKALELPEIGADCSIHAEDGVSFETLGDRSVVNARVVSYPDTAGLYAAEGTGEQQTPTLGTSSTIYAGDPRRVIAPFEQQGEQGPAVFVLPHHGDYEFNSAYTRLLQEHSGHLSWGSFMDRDPADKISYRKGGFVCACEVETAEGKAAQAALEALFQTLPQEALPRTTIDTWQHEPDRLDVGGSQKGKGK